jgi:hypothetical protein
MSLFFRAPNNNLRLVTRVEPGVQLDAQHTAKSLARMFARFFVIVQRLFHSLPERQEGGPTQAQANSDSA